MSWETETKTELYKKIAGPGDKGYRAAIGPVVCHACGRNPCLCTPY